jgi:hypothetical protein
VSDVTRLSQSAKRAVHGLLSWRPRRPRGEQSGLQPAIDPAGRPGDALVPLTIVPGLSEAELIVGLLRDFDLSAVVSADDAGGTEPELVVQGVRVLVAHADVPSARRVLANVKGATVEADDDAERSSQGCC